MKYEELTPIAREDALAAIGRGGLEAGRAVLRVALHDGDQSFAEMTCVQAATSSADELAYAGIVGLGHVARIHGRISDDALKLLQRFVEHSASPVLRDIAENALSDATIFMTKRRR